MDRLWTDHGQIMDRSWTDHGQIMDKSWTDHGNFSINSRFVLSLGYVICCEAGNYLTGCKE